MTTSNKKTFPSAAFLNTGIDTIVERYEVTFDTVQTSPYDALTEAQAVTTTPDPVPKLRTVYPGKTNIFCTQISPTITDESRKQYYYDVTYQTPEPNSQGPLQQAPNPNDRPGQRNIEYIASEYVVHQARNVEALPHGNGSGGDRAANTIGPIVNAAGKRPDEPIVDTEYNGVLVFTKNYPTLGAIDSLNNTYRRTTNDSLTLGVYPERTLKYLVTESLGQQFEGDIEYWPGQTRIEIKSTDLILDNVGYDYWDDNADSGAGGWVRAKGGENGDEDLAEPINLDLDGFKGGDHTTTITYRHLEPVDYGPLFS